MSALFGSRGVRHGRWQASLAVAAIAAAVALPVILVSVGGGVADHELHALENSGYQLVVSAPGSHGISFAHNVSARIDRLAGVVAAAPVLSVSVDAFNSTGKFSGVLAEGVVPASFALTLGPTEEGLFPLPLPLGDPNDSVHFAGGTYGGTGTWDVLVSSTFASSFGLAVGDRLVVSPTVNASDGVTCNVTGVFGVPFLFGTPSGAYAIVLPLSDLQVLTHLAAGPGTSIPDAADTVEVVATGPVAASPSALASLENAIANEFPAYSVSSLSQEVQQLEQASSLLTGFYLALSSVGLTVGVIFLALVLLRRVETERRSIGIRRALGVPGHRIVVGVLREGVVLAGAGSVTGVIAGWALVRGLATWATATVKEAAGLAVFDPETLGEIVVAVVGLALLASVVAARRAVRIDLLEALR